MSCLYIKDDAFYLIFLNIFYLKINFKKAGTLQINILPDFLKFDKLKILTQIPMVKVHLLFFPQSKYFIINKFL